MLTSRPRAPQHETATALCAGIALGLCAGCADAPVISSDLTDRDWSTVTHRLERNELEAAPSLEVRRDLIIGSAGGADYQLGEIRGMDVDDAGNVFVMERGRGVVVFDRRGRYLRTFAPAGPGPEEQRSFRDVAVGGDTVFVHDVTLKMFSPTGEYLGQLNPVDVVEHVTRFMASRTISYTSKGIAAVRPYSEGWSSRDLEVFERRDELTMIDVAAGGAEVASHALEYPSWKHGVRATSGPPMGGVHPLIVAARDGRVFTTDPEFLSVKVWSYDGDLLQHVFGDVERVPVTQTDLDDYARVYEVEEQDRLPQLRRELRATPRARYRPAIRQLLVSRDGHVIIERPDLSERPYDRTARDTPTVWQLFDAEWNVLGTFRLPSGFRPAVFSGCAIVGSALSDDDAPIVVRYVIEGAALTPCPHLASREPAR